MINYYYEIKDNVKIFDKGPYKYIAHFDIKHVKGVASAWRIWHDQAVKHSTRVWMENANGVTLVKAPVGDMSWGRVNEQQLVWLKLICRDVESL